jgi:hypothetical protein
MAVTTIQLTPSTRDVLRASGRKGETYDQIIRRLLRATEYSEFMEEQYQILRSSSGWKRLEEIR